jgi:FkbM family methyltransferase
MSGGKKRKVLLFLPCYGGKIEEETSATVAGIIRALVEKDMFFGYMSSSHADIVRVRNGFLTYWYDNFPDCTDFLLIDADMACDARVVLDMIAFDKPIVGAIYPSRGSDEIEWVVRTKKGARVTESGFMEVAGVGGGLLLIQREAITQMLEAGQIVVHDRRDDKYVDWKFLDKNGIARIFSAFDPTVEVDVGVLSDDYSFCERYNRSGGTIWANAVQPIGHVGKKEWNASFLRKRPGMSGLHLRDLLKPERKTSVIDIGAAAFDGTPLYADMLLQGLCTVTGFEPNPAEYEHLKQFNREDQRYLPHLIGRGGHETLTVCQSPGMTSIKEIDQGIAGFFRMTEHCKTVSAGEHISVMLDQVLADELIPEAKGDPDGYAWPLPVDFLKIDVQGAEMDVLNGQMRTLSSAVVVQVEVPFIPFYEGQASFAEIDKYLRGRGFILHRLIRQKHLPVWQLPNWKVDMATQVIDADAIYVKNYINPVTPLTVEQWKHLSLLAHCVLGAPDLACGAASMVSKEAAATYERSFG